MKQLVVLLNLLYTPRKAALLQFLLPSFQELPVPTSHWADFPNFQFLMDFQQVSVCCRVLRSSTESQRIQPQTGNQFVGKDEGKRHLRVPWGYNLPNATVCSRCRSNRVRRRHQHPPPAHQQPTATWQVLVTEFENHT